jgi:hypothetical protein
MYEFDEASGVWTQPGADSSNSYESLTFNDPSSGWVSPYSESYTTTGIPSQWEQGYGGSTNSPGVAPRSALPQAQFSNNSSIKPSGYYGYGSSSGGGSRVGAIPAPTKTLAQYRSLMDQIGSPVIETYPTYTAPAWDDSKVSKYASKFASPYISEMRKAIRDAIVRTSSTTSPIQRRYQLGSALEKSGEGMGKIMSQANVFGANQYQNEYNRSLDESKVNFTSGMENTRARNTANQQRYMAFYNTALADFMSGKLTV